MPLSRKDDRKTGQQQTPAAVHAPDPSAYIPSHQLPEKGMDGDFAYEVLTNELLLDGQARLNLATFVTTWMPSVGAKIMADTMDKNMIDKDEYPQTAAIETRCVNILADLWHSPEAEDATGCSTTGSSEAAMLAGMALKWRWRARQRQAGRPTDKPNLVMGINVQVCWEKFCRYWEVEPRVVPMEGDRFHLGPEEAAAQCDENTIGVVAILGSTFDGSYEPVKEIAAALDKLESDKGWDIPIHVDAASGGFVAPFLQPDLEWDFRIERVQSINASGHKYGLVYPGVGWAIWRDKAALPKDLVFDVNYLGGNMPTFALNFSRPGSQVVAQYYMFTTLGREGYTRVMQNAQDVAMLVSSGIEQMGPFELLTRGEELPVFAFKLRDGVDKYTVFDVSEYIRMRGWLIPAYTFPKNREDLSVLRIVVRAGLNHDMGHRLLEQLGQQTEQLESLDAPLPKRQTSARQAFKH
ncbi:MAG TPA: glutamate decarboxylase [Solirubrobacteraceae bacterium]|nr:glutamate decarboxylase [Solirubrobacteraceae bacterium]